RAQPPTAPTAGSWSHKGRRASNSLNGHPAGLGPLRTAAYDPSVEKASPTVAESAADRPGALAPYSAELSDDIYALIVREIPQLRTDNRILALLEASVAENVATVL